MNNFLKEIVENEKYELLIDTNIFPKNIILKAAYNFLDRGYFYFKQDGENIILQFTKNSDNNEKIETILGDFNDELLSVYLRDSLEKENKVIRESIVSAAINNSIDEVNFQSINTDIKNNEEKNEIDFDKDIDDILKEIENDPELKIDEDEIEKILMEIENEVESENKDSTPSVELNLEGLKAAKNKFKK